MIRQSQNVVEKVMWQTVAEDGGMPFTSQIRFGDLEEILPNELDIVAPPMQGSLPREETAQLTDILAGSSTTDAIRCWLGLWAGFGGIERPPSATLHLPNRIHLLLHGTLADASNLAAATGLGTYNSPSIWWPESRRWFVATDIDFRSTYVGGSAKCIEAIMSSTLECVSTDAEADVSYR